MKIAVVASEVPSDLRKIIDIDSYLVYACDGAVEPLLKQKIAIELAIGDFDSLENQSLLEGIKVIKLSEVKDYSDTYFALQKAYESADEVILIGGIKGNRADHFIANVMLLEKYPDLIIMDETNKIKLLTKGTYPIKKEGFTYLSIFPLEDIKITLTGVLYPLIEEELSCYDVLGLSNEIKSKYATLHLHRGTILLIQSKEK